MLIINSRLNISTSYPLQYPYTWEDVIFFDIETTGLSAKTSYLYLIGCMYYFDNTWQTTQWFADDLASERLIIEEFVTKLKGYKKIVHYNGTGFDIPFILQKCKLYQIPNPFETIESYDIYKNILPFKKLLPIENLKLKTVENFVGIKREDTKSGEELIQIYSNYLGRNQYEKLHQKRTAKPLTNKFTQENSEVSNLDFKEDSKQDHKTNTYTYNSTLTQSSDPTSDDLLNMLLLHNKEDIQGLLSVTDILYYHDVFQLFSESLLEKYKLEQNISLEQNGANYYNFTVTLPFQIVKPISWSIPLFHNTDDTFIRNIEDTSVRNASTEGAPTINNNIVLSLDKNLLTIQIPIYTGELKFFFDNYKEYYYLPKEDMAIHKSVAEYVDKDYRLKAKPDTCYNRLTSSFLPQTKDIFSPSFKIKYKDKLSFFETNNTLNPASNNLDKQDKFLEYISDWLHYFMNSKEINIIL